jgi:hypothetical protein
MKAVWNALMLLTIALLCLSTLSQSMDTDKPTVSVSGSNPVPIYSPDTRRETFILEGEERGHITSKGWTEIGEITLRNFSYLDARPTSIVKLIEDITLYDNSTFEIFSKEIEISSDITLYDNATLTISTENIVDDHFFLINGTITLHDNSSILVQGKYDGIDKTDRVIFNRRISLSGDSEFHLRNLRTELRSPIKLENNCSMTVLQDCYVTWNPNIDLGQYEPLLNLSGTSELTIDNSKFYVNPPNWRWNPDEHARYDANYLYSEGNSEVYVHRSHFSVILPGNVIEEYLHVTGGTILVTGSSKWSFLDSTVYGELNYTQFLWNEEEGEYEEISHYVDPGPGNDSYVKFTRWFWLSSQMDGSVYIESCPEVRLAEPGQVFFKPTSGFFTLKDSDLYGIVQPETIAKVDIESSNLEYVNNQKGWVELGLDYPMKIFDSVSGRIANSTLVGNMEIGWSSMNTNLGLAKVDLVMENNEVTGHIHCYANTKLELIDNDLAHGEVIVEGNTSLSLVDQEMEGILSTDGGWEDWHLLMIELFDHEPSGIDDLDELKEELEMVDMENLTRYPVGSGLKDVFAENRIELGKESEIIQLDLRTWNIEDAERKYKIEERKESDEETKEDIEFLRFYVYKKENISLFLSNSVIGNITPLSENSTFNIRMTNNSQLGLVNCSRRNSFAVIRTEDSSQVDDYMIDDGSEVQTTMVNPEKSDIPSSVIQGLTVFVNYVSSVKVTMNGTPMVNATVEVDSQDFHLLSLSNPNGEVFWEHTYEAITSGGKSPVVGETSTVKVSYFALSKTASMDMDLSNQVVVGLQDTTTPTISNLDHTAKFGSWSLKKTIFFSVDVEDAGVEALDFVILRYSIDGGPWRNATMVKTSETKYEGGIGRQNFVTIEYYVVCKDTVGNTAVSEKNSITVGREETITVLIILGITSIILIVLIAVKVKNTITLNKYLQNRFNKNRYPNLSKPETKKK